MTRSPEDVPARYLPIMTLATGGFGTVDLVVRRDGTFRRVFARKRLLPERRRDPKFVAMFLEEGRVAGLIRHRNVVSVTDVGEACGEPYMIMDFVDGVPLSTLIRDAAGAMPLPLAVVVRIGAEVARGLDAAHELKDHAGRPLHLVHRDVTPQNILLGWDGSVRVTDFGIVRALGRTHETSTGILKGKLGYMSPEQLRFREPDRRSDVFGLGVVLMEAFMGRRLYGGTGYEPARRILDEPPPDLGSFRSDAPPELVELLFDMLAKEPDDRVASCGEVADRLERVARDLLLDDALDEPPLELAELLESRYGSLREARRAKIEAAMADEPALEHRAAMADEPARSAPIDPEPTSVVRRGSRAGLVVAVVIVAIAAGAGGFLMGMTDRVDPVLAPVRAMRAPSDETSSASTVEAPARPEEARFAARAPVLETDGAVPESAGAPRRMQGPRPDGGRARGRARRTQRRPARTAREAAPAQPPSVRLPRWDWPE